MRHEISRRSCGKLVVLRAQPNRPLKRPAPVMQYHRLLLHQQLTVHGRRGTSSTICEASVQSPQVVSDHSTKARVKRLRLNVNIVIHLHFCPSCCHCRTLDWSRMPRWPLASQCLLYLLWALSYVYFSQLMDSIPTSPHW
jgi:hypothetical protein